jgi:hypothetical protein
MFTLCNSSYVYYLDMNFGATHTHLPLLEGNTINIFTNSLDTNLSQASDNTLYRIHISTVIQLIRPWVDSMSQASDNTLYRIHISTVIQLIPPWVDSMMVIPESCIRVQYMRYLDCMHTLYVYMVMQMSLELSVCIYMFCYEG